MKPNITPFIDLLDQLNQPTLKIVKGFGTWAIRNSFNVLTRRSNFMHRLNSKKRHSIDHQETR